MLINIIAPQVSQNPSIGAPSQKIGANQFQSPITIPAVMKPQKNANTIIDIIPILNQDINFPNQLFSIINISDVYSVVFKGG